MCPPGPRFDTTRASCQQCGANTYRAGHGLDVACSPCPSHSTSDAGSASAGDCGCGALAGAGLLRGAAAFFCVSKMLCGSKREKKGSLTAEPGGDGIYADEAL